MVPDRPTFQAAGDDQVEMVEVCGDVQGQAVHRRVLVDFGVKGQRDPGATGVWVA